MWVCVVELILASSGDENPRVKKALRTVSKLEGLCVDMKPELLRGERGLPLPWCQSKHWIIQAASTELKTLHI